MCIDPNEYKISATIGFTIDDPLTILELEALHEECLKVYNSNGLPHEWHISLGTISVSDESVLTNIIQKIRQIAAWSFSDFYVCPATGIMEVLPNAKPQSQDMVYSLGCQLHPGNSLANEDDTVLERLCRLVKFCVCTHREAMTEYLFPHIVIGEVDATAASRTFLTGVSSRLSPIMLHPQNINFFQLRISRKRPFPFDDCDAPSPKRPRDENTGSG